MLSNTHKPTVGQFIAPIDAEVEVNDVDTDEESGMPIRNFTGINNPRTSTGLTSPTKPITPPSNNSLFVPKSLSYNSITSKHGSIDLDEGETNSPKPLKDDDIAKIVQYLHETHHPALHPPKKITPTAKFVHDIKCNINTKRQWVQSIETPCLDHFCHQLLWITQGSFTIATITLLGFYIAHDHPASFVNTFFVQAIAAVAYFIKANHVGEFKMGETNVPIVRYVDWITTTPLMLYEICHIAHAKTHEVIMVIGCDLLMLGLGITAACIDSEKHFGVKYGVFCIACVFFIILVATMHVDVAGHLDHIEDDDAHDKKELFHNLETLTIATWSFYPIAVLLGRAHFGLITDSVEDGLICILDMISKIGMEGLVIAFAISHYSNAGDDHGGGGH